ncbi:hypothetical protein AX766_09445 [Flavobacterium covae]|uniref:glycosyltransferase family 2 protein n=1 Tax=Flavobacterium covae TaxID=2906076 RepID=UPI0007C1E266|nr:glycosyltransferase family 2 protein [Flavobacterium covae]AND64626.1 hypothetical protein AX766_09445 [Flavobacterium covae]
MSKIAVLLPTYNGAKFIKEQIDSILNQSHQNIELLIRDDSSTDNTIEILRSIASQDNRVKLFEDSSGNLGLVKSIEYLLSETNCEWIMFSDQDDVWFDTKIEEFYKVAIVCDHKIPSIIHSDAIVTNEKLIGNKRFLGSRPLKNGVENSLFLFSVQGCSMMINNVLKESLFPFPKEAYLHDRYIHLVVELIGKRLYIDKPLMWYRQHGGNVVGTNSLFKKIKNLFFIKQNYFLPVDKDLVNYVFESKAPNHVLFACYKAITSSHISRFKKMVLLYKFDIPMRLKEKILLLFKN